MSSSILLVSGSLRRLSTNTALLRTAAAHAPAGVRCLLYDGLDELPHFNPDDEQPPCPEPVESLRRAIHEADGLLFSVPEYAGALPGSFKNLLDWSIGDAEPGSIYEKPVGWINCSARGAAGAHAELRTVLNYAHATIVAAACLEVPITASMIGEDGLIAGISADDLTAVLQALSVA